LKGQALNAVRGRHWDQSPGLDGEVGAVDYQEAVHLLPCMKHGSYGEWPCLASMALSMCV
jgi:hypothetical protein